MMKRKKHLLLKGLILMIMAAFTFTQATAQEEKEEKKVIKIRMVTDDDGNTTIDTTIVLDEDFDGDWKALIEDEELLEQIENIEIDLNLDDDGNIYLIKSPHTTKKAYYYSVESDDDGEVTVKVEHEMEDIHDFDWRRFQLEYRDHIDLAKLLQLIPGFGALIGAYVNLKLTKKLGEFAMNAYRMRLLDKPIISLSSQD